jgi:hypothetical protein
MRISPPCSVEAAGWLRWHDDDIDDDLLGTNKTTLWQFSFDLALLQPIRHPKSPIVI